MRMPSGTARDILTEPLLRITSFQKDTIMWYFAWILGLPLAAAFAVLNAMWFELMEDEATRRDRLDPKQP